VGGWDGTVVLVVDQPEMGEIGESLGAAAGPAGSTRSSNFERRW
jgi:hypothetical protein